MLMSLPGDAEGPASGARRPQAGDVRIEARRAKTWRAFGQGLVHESRPPKGARLQVVVPSITSRWLSRKGWITVHANSIPVIYESRSNPATLGFWHPASTVVLLRCRWISQPAADYYEPPISLDELLNIRAPHIWIVKVEGESMRDAGIFTGTRLIIDRTVTACSGHIVMAYVDNQPLVKRLAKSPAGWTLESANPAYKSVTPDEYSTVEVFDVVTWSLSPHEL